MASQNSVAALVAENLANKLDILEHIQVATNAVLELFQQEGPNCDDNNKTDNPSSEPSELVAADIPSAPKATETEPKNQEEEANRDHQLHLQQVDQAPIEVSKMENLQQVVESATVAAAAVAVVIRDLRDQIYCSGSLLAAVQNARLFGDCKHFVDMPLKTDAESTLNAWKLLHGGVENGKMDLSALSTFVSEYFDQPGGELEDYQPSDFNAEQDFSCIADPHFRAWAQHLHRKWPTLCRRVSEKVRSDPNKYSLIPLPKPFVVPGGRFREMYYWDSFFTIKGLLASGMFATVRGMIENMGHLIDQYGFVPNGNRVYYLNRSQPPLLTWCVNAYYQATHDVEFIRSAMPWLEKEMNFFTTNKRFSRPDWKTYLFRYHVVAQGPRPESYREDVESAEHIQDDLEKCRLWGDIAAAAESGRDFSARWFTNDGPMAGKMGSTRTSSILPVDLNSIVCGNLKIFAEFYELLGNPEASAHSRTQFELMRETIHNVFWNEEHGCWFDYDIITQQHINVYYDTNFFPLFADCTHPGFNGSRIVEYLTKVGVLAFPGGLPTSLITSGQQWDFPNAWAPTTWVIIQGLRAAGETKLARTIAEKWIKKNYMMWLKNDGRMYEKYNVASDCYKNAGAGGEYEVQEGFGWTNGVILDLLKTYQSELRWSTADEYAVSECECCRVPPIMPPQPQIADIMSQQLIMNNSNVPLVIVPQPTEPMLIHNAMSVASPVEPQAIFIQHVPTQQQIQE
ncbi:trehalase domain-containing protein [Ditylenchus destructor]|nr:trehalase domain-containing protein [Ditylenchus destructor]